MCDYCGCRRSGPTAELANEHVRLLELGERLHDALHNGKDATTVLAEFVRLLQMHAPIGSAGGHVPDALRLLATHIDDEEYDLFPHIFHALDPEQRGEIELAHRAIEAVWDDGELASPAKAAIDAATGSVTS